MPHPEHPAGFRGTCSNPKALQITWLRSISYLYQETSMYCPKHTAIYRQSKNPSSYPSAAPFQHSIPKNPLSTRRTYHPFQYPIIAPSTRPTPTKHRRWAITGHLSGHTGRTVLTIKSGSHFRVQSQMQSCIQSCKKVKRYPNYVK